MTAQLTGDVQETINGLRLVYTSDTLEAYANDGDGGYRLLSYEAPADELAAALVKITMDNDGVAPDMIGAEHEPDLGRVFLFFA